MTIKAYFSNRIYKDDLNSNFVKDTQHTLFTFNQAKHFRLQEEVREKRGSKAKSKQSFHLRVKAKYGLNDYYANSAVQEGKALLTSQKELNQMYTTNKKEQIKSVKKKIKTTKSNLTVLKKIKSSFIKGKQKLIKPTANSKKEAFSLWNLKIKLIFTTTVMILNIYI